MRKLFLIIIALSVLACEPNKKSQDLSVLHQYSTGMKPRWSSPENRNAQPGKGGMENGGAKGHAFDPLPAGASIELMRTEGTGMITRMWITVADRSPEMLRSLRLEIFWDGQEKPAVAAPFGDFFGVGLGRTAKFNNTLFMNPEGRSFQCLIPMPFKTGARVVVTNDSPKDLSHIFWDIDFLELKDWDEDNLYFHTYWSRDTATTLGVDFELLPALKGKGRFLGVNAGINANPIYGTSWWGEGEVKVYLDGDTEFPTLAGTGTEDYIGTGWGQGEYFNDYAGCLIADPPKRQWAFYRYHVLDPIFFDTGCRVTLQQIGGNPLKDILTLQQADVPLIPVTVDNNGKLISIYSKDLVTDLSTSDLPDGWTNYYRSDDLSATAYFYLDQPTSNLPSLATVSDRIYQLKSTPQQ